MGESGKRRPRRSRDEWQRLIEKQAGSGQTDAEGHTSKHLEGFELVREGSMSEAEYERGVRDLVNFLAYVGEPAKLLRQRLGVWVLAFLVLLFVVTYAMKKEFWKDVH